MQNTERLSFINNKSVAEINNLLQNCFEGSENWHHMIQHIPEKFQPRSKTDIGHFLKRPDTWLIKRNNEQDIIGFLSHGNFLPGMPNNIGFNVGLQYTGKGYATEALKALLQHLKTKGYNETFGHCLETNTASIKTMEKCGFMLLSHTIVPELGLKELKFRVQF